MPIPRRAILNWATSLAGALGLSSLRVWARAVNFPAGEADTLRALAAAVLPSEPGAPNTDRTAEAFVTWVRGYRAGAEMDHGYGATRLRSKAVSPAPNYLRHLEALHDALRLGDMDSKRQAVTLALEQARITELPRSPDGRHVAADLMAFYFRSSDANDLCYRAAIGRDQCRGLDGSEQAPAPLKGRA
ncbi:MAG TPA: hypothetical protein VMQ86_00590 [Bryobacteraceae bacterium]|jgi:hypothetical protein|nr:hypothetical protein [Bryobacteraceae bacterium]